MRIVIVDDDSIVLMSLKTIIEAGGIEVLATGKSGAEAVGLYEKYQPDILLSDIRMEGMDGITAAGMVLEKYPEARVLFLTTFSDDEYVVNALKCGAKGYILKQAQVLLLFHMIRWRTNQLYRYLLPQPFRLI